MALIFFLSWVVIGLFTRSGPTSAHEWSRLGTVESIVERHSLELDGSKFRSTRDRILNRGHWYSHQPPLLAILESPVYWVLHQFGLRFANNAPFDLTFLLFTWLTNGIAFAAAVVAFDLILGRLAPELRYRGAFAVLIPLGTWMFPYSVVPNNHGVSAALLMFLAERLLKMDTRDVTEGDALFVGLILGLLCAIEVLPAVSFFPAVALYWYKRTLFGPTFRRTFAFAAGLATPVIAHTLANVQVTGDWIPAGFHTELFTYEGTTFSPDSLSGSIKYPTLGAFLDYSSEALLFGKGFFALAPLLIAGLCSAPAAWRARPQHRNTFFVLGFGTALSLLAALLTTNNFGGVAVGFRHATYLIPALLTFLAATLSNKSRAGFSWSIAVIVLAALSVGVHAIHTVPQPWHDLRLTTIYGNES